MLSFGLVIPTQIYYLNILSLSWFCIILHRLYLVFCLHAWANIEQGFIEMWDLFQLRNNVGNDINMKIFSVIKELKI